MAAEARPPDEVRGRRARRTRETYTEIKSVALSQLARHGPGGVSMRAIARELEMTASAVHYYFATRDALLDALVSDGFDDLAIALRTTYLEGADLSPEERWLVVTRAFRAWALAQPAHYLLIYGSTGGQVARVRPKIAQSLGRVVAVFYDMMRDCYRGGVVDVARLEDDTPASTRAELAWWRETTEELADLPDGALAGCMLCYSRLHGAIALELAGHIPPALADRDALFDLQMRHTATALRPLLV